MYENLAILAIFAFIYSAIAGRMEKTMISGPMIFVAFGLIFGDVGLGLLEMDVTQTELRVIADLTLALILFIDAANADLSVLKRRLQIPKRMLAVGLPLIILLGFVAGWLIFDSLSLFELAILATMLAATDAALGKAVVTNEAVPSRIREGLNAESGLNDGICVPILFVFIALAVGSEVEGSTMGLALKLVAQEIGIGLVVGLGLTFLGAKVLKYCYARGWVTEIWGQIPVVGLAFGSFALAQSLHGSGYIAAFTGGILFGFLAKQQTHKLVHAAEGVGETLALLTWVVFGAAVVGDLFQYFNWQVILYAVLSLTIVRMLPVYVSLTGTGENNHSKLFLGWFGPRGLASIVFAIIVLNENLPGGKVLAITVACTVFLSVLAHGISANPLANAFARKQPSAKKD
ncbi:MAG: cation:proton antiporter [Gammaproteobacteria bacterium]|nr:cation:proton antiporter [Gammaproteobacteria bacterium]